MTSRARRHRSAGAINSPIPYTKSTVYACVRHLIGGDPPNNEGYFRPIEVRAPAGTVVNPVLPAPVAARGLTGFRIANAVFGALAQIAPDRVFACESGGDTGISYGGYHPDGRPFVFIEFLYGSWGGRPDRDGVDALLVSSIVNFSNNPIEIIESEQPLLIERYGYVPDTGGAGEFRGGLAVVRDYRFEVAPGADAQFLMRTDRRRFVPYGLAGGRPGRPRPTCWTRMGRAADAADQGPAHRPPRRPRSATRSRAPAAGATRCSAIRPASSTTCARRS